MENVENGPQNGSPDRRGHFLVIWLLFSVPDGLGSPNGSQASPKSPQGQSKPRFLSIFGRFLMIFWWFSVSYGLLFIWFASLLFWLPRGFICKFLATSSNVLGSSAGVRKVTKKCEDWQSKSAKTVFSARWRACRRQLRLLVYLWIINIILG